MDDVSAGTGRHRSGVRVTGLGSAMSSPDVVRVQLSTTALRPRLTEALAVAEDAARRVRAVLAGFDVQGHDASTAGLSARAEQDWSGPQGPRVTGFRAEHALAVTVRDVSSIGRVLGDVLAAGGDDIRLDSMQFAVEDETALRVLARERAWADALARAVQLATLAGRELGDVVDVAEGEAPVGGPAPIRARMVAAEAVGVEPGQVGVDVSLRVRWVLL